LDCLFCKIAAGEIPSQKVYEDEDVLAFSDISPVAPLHVLIIPKKHIESLAALSDDDSLLASKMLFCARDIAREKGFAEDGYRVVTNCGARAGQSVKHIHLHLLAGRDFEWPPG